MRIFFYAISLYLAVTLAANAFPTAWLEMLDSEDYTQRVEAHRQLEKWVKQAEKSELEALVEFSQQTDSPEVKSRLKDIIGQAYIAVPNTQGFLGVTLEPILGGAVVASTLAGQPADVAGLKEGDVIVKLDAKNLKKMRGSESHAMMYLKGYVKKRNEGEKLKLEVLRGEKRIELELRLGNLDTYLEHLERKRNPDFN